MFISQVLYLNHIVLHGLDLLLLVHPIYAQLILLSEINSIKRPSITEDSNDANETMQLLSIFVSLTMAIKVAH